ncbi:GAF domain-containing protein [Actinoplanes sp. CA-252034]|uniref:GAF domain-containing protein n=1 Tax=Actinoplanes sp. CA-252034 TaxID=3239906 RepID=UPI003D99A846
MSTVSAERLATIFVEAADTLVDEFDLLDFLSMLTDRARDLVGAAAAGLALADEHGRLGFVAGSDDNVRLVELFQIQNDQGPCLEAFRTGRPVINVDLAAATARWPRFAPARPRRASVRCTHSLCGCARR